MRLVWTDPAALDRQSIYEYLERENPRAALKLDDRFVQVAELLQKRPFLGRPGRIVGTREFVVNPRYILVYRVADEEIRIVAVVHTARQWPPE